MRKQDKLSSSNSLFWPLIPTFTRCTWMHQCSSQHLCVLVQTLWPKSTVSSSSACSVWPQVTSPVPSAAAWSLSAGRREAPPWLGRFTVNHPDRTRLPDRLKKDTVSEWSWSCDGTAFSFFSLWHGQRRTSVIKEILLKSLKAPFYGRPKWKW